MELSVVEQRYRAVLAAQRGESKQVVAAQFGISRQTLHTWLQRYRDGGLGGLMDRSHRPESCPNQADVRVETWVCEMRREHLRWGPRRIAYELGSVVPHGVLVPSRATVYWILVRHKLIEPGTRRRRREDYRRWQRDAPMALWQLDIVGGLRLVGGGEAKIVTGVDDHSRFCVLATVLTRATGRAVCLAFADALRCYGIPEEILTDNGKQFTDRFGQGGEVLFDRICRDNGITHRLTQPASPTTTGKIERFHGSLRRELLNDADPFDSVLAAQAALDSWVAAYNCQRPHQSLDMAMPVDRFAPSQTDRGHGEELLPLRLPSQLTLAPAVPQQSQGTGEQPEAVETASAGPTEAYTGGPVEFDRVVPPSGNLAVRGKQFWLGPAQSGVTVTFWADCDLIHLTVGGAQVKTVRSHLSVNDLHALAATGARPPEYHRCRRSRPTTTAERSRLIAPSAAAA